MLVKWGLTQACQNIFKSNWKLNHWHFRNDIQIYHLKLQFYFLLKHRWDVNIPMKKNLTWITWSSNLTRSLGLGIFSANSLRKQAFAADSRCMVKFYNKRKTSAIHTYIKLYLNSNFRVANKLISSSWHYIKLYRKYIYTLNARKENINYNSQF